MDVKKKINNDELTIIGWREWVALPELGITRIKAKVDTGARTSALHAFKLNPYKDKGVQKIRFSIHPIQHNQVTAIDCDAVVTDSRWVTDSGGHREKRYVIQTPCVFGQTTHDIELTLTNRDSMLFRMLLGRTGLKNHFVVHPAASFLLQKETK